MRVHAGLQYEPVAKKHLHTSPSSMHVHFLYLETNSVSLDKTNGVQTATARDKIITLGYSRKKSKKLKILVFFLLLQILLYVSCLREEKVNLDCW